MSGKPGVNDVLWYVSGTAVLLALMMAVMLFAARTRPDPAKKLASKLQRIERVNRMQVALGAAVEAEKSAVLAISDADALQFAGQVRDATADIMRASDEYGDFLKIAGNPEEKELWMQFTQVFAEFRRIDRDLLALAVKNSNWKASSLTFGSATAAVTEMDAALARLTIDAVKPLRLADNARIAAWRLLTLLPPHIAEESDAKMDAMEAVMVAEDRKVRQSLDALIALPEFANNADVQTAVIRYARFTETKAEVLRLSRENTNVRSLAISLNEKRKITHVCQATLATLRHEIESEPVSSVAYGTVKPR